MLAHVRVHTCARAHTQGDTQQKSRGREETETSVALVGLLAQQHRSHPIEARTLSRPLEGTRATQTRAYGLLGNVAPEYLRPLPCSSAVFICGPNFLGG